MRRVAVAALLLAAAPLLARPVSAPVVTVAEKPGSPALGPNFEVLVIRAIEVGRVLRGDGLAERTFAPLFLAQIPPDKLKEIGQGLIAQWGPLLEVSDIDVVSATAARFRIRFAKGTASAVIEIEPVEPRKVIGFRITDIVPLDNSPEAIVKDFSALGGKSGFTITRLGDGAPVEVLGYNADQQHAIGSAFKLWVLDALAEDIARGKRKWNDVVPLTVRSLPSGEMQDWPQGTPVTLATLATMMISVSDNTATDQLMQLLGRDAIAARVRATGHSDPSRTLPFLTTLEAFTLKLAPEADVMAYSQADDAGQVAILDRLAPTLAADRLNANRFAVQPLWINQIEWFASPRDLAGVLNSLKNRADPMVMKILSVNPGLGPDVAVQFARFGFKGGSEAGVLNLSFVVQNKAGEWYAVSASWNDGFPMTVNQTRFIPLVRRLLDRVK